MNRFFFIAALLAIITVAFTPAPDVLCPRHDEAEVPHAAQDDDCGCACHDTVSAVVAARAVDVHLLSAAAVCFTVHSLPEPIPTAIERPPELCS